MPALQELRKSHPGEILFPRGGSPWPSPPDGSPVETGHRRAGGRRRCPQDRAGERACQVSLPAGAPGTQDVIALQREAGQVPSQVLVPIAWGRDEGDSSPVPQGSQAPRSTQRTLLGQGPADTWPTARPHSARAGEMNTGPNLMLPQARLMVMGLDCMLCCPHWKFFFFF